MDLQTSIRHLLEEVGPGQRITRSAYDTAWLARLAELGNPLGEQALDWLRNHQLADGSWGAAELCYCHDRLICTLAAMAALAWQRDERDTSRLRRAQFALEAMTQGLRSDPAGETIGFEMILPALLAEGKQLGIFSPQLNGELNRFYQYREAKLSRLPQRVITRHVTVAFSSEMVGPDGLGLLDVENLQETNGSVAYSPSSTAFFARYVRPHDPGAMGYLQSVAVEGAVPYTAPIDVFERGWVLWNLSLTGNLDGELLALCQPHLDFLESQWTPGKGIPAVSNLTLIDGDTTALVYEVLLHMGRMVDVQAILRYEQGDHFRCFELEANPSISTNIHVLSALRTSGWGVQEPSVRKVLEYLQRTKTLSMFWFDKWHASPYYPTAHAIIACAGYADWLVEDAVYWLEITQCRDGSWGYYRPTAEETAYCLQALLVWQQLGKQVPHEVLKRGVAWLAEHADPPYPPLWIGKSLYCPVWVVRSAILSALWMAQGG
ncbi:MAG: type B diterpene cyclase [Anaerolineae bacterium]